ncbi:uncharacterized protein LOC142358563 isoform X2 [Convolutriloba macropyga]|uniref:uncharacterized protein LOC142358563 isoform X2 n=1 Tax=Convolutriloba macropyga TaxID=536237 RepID=UPI003F52248D
MYYHQKDVTVHSNHPVESNYEYNFNNDNGYVGMNEVYERNPMQTTQRFPVQNGSSPMGNGGVSYNNEFAMSRTSNYKSSSGVPENMRLVDSEVASQRYVAPRSNKRETTKVIRETLEDGTVISRQIVVEEEDTLIERRLYKYEATSPLMSRKMDPAQAMAVQTGVHQAAEYAEDDDDITAKFSRYEAELEARRQQQQQQQQRKTHDDVNGWGSRYGSKGGNLEGSGTEEGHYVEGYGPVSPNEGSSSAAQKFNNIPSSNYHVLLSSHNQRGNGPYDDSKGHRQHRDQLPSNSFTLNRDSNSNSNSDGSYNQFPSPSVESSFYTDPQLLRPSPFNNPDQQPKLPDPYSRGHNSKAKGGPRQSYVKSNSLPRNRLDSVRNQQSSSSVPNRNGVGSKNPHLSPGANLEFKNPHHSMSAFTKCDVSPFELLKLSSSNQPGSISDHYASPQLVVHTDPKFPSPSTAGSNSPHRIVPPTEHEFGLMDPESKLKLIQNLTEGDYASRPDDYVGSFSSLRKSDISKISPSTDAVAKSAPPRQMRYNESFKHASNNAFFGSDDLKPSPRSNQFEHLSHHRNDRSGDALISPGGRMDSQRPSESHYTYDLPGGSDFNRNNKQNGHLTTEPYQGKRESGFTTTHGFPLLSGRQKSTPDISQHLDNDYVPNYDNTHLVAKQRGFKMSADNLIDEDSVVARDASRSQQNAGLDFAPRPSPKPKLLPLQKHHAPQSNKLTEMVLEKSCGRCLEKLQPGQDLITSSGEIFHKECFVCAACFRPFPDGVYYDFDNRKYCEEDFNLLFAPNCQACGDFVKGRVIKAMGGKSWHAECFVCSRCETPLADTGFHTVKSEPDKPYCKPCSEYMMKLESGKRFCGKCHAQIENDGLRIKDEWFHAYHFNCTKCNAELTPTARESEGKLYCLKCSDSRTCALCRRTIEKFERSLVALNKSWHPDCFRCSFCDKPFNGDKHFVYNAQPYCEEHYNQLFGNLCFYCNRIVPSPGVSIEQKIRKYCEHHFECFFCGKSLTPNTDVVMLDSRPVCMKCTQRFPGDFKNQCFKNRGVSIGASLNPKAKLLNPFKKK